MGDTLAIEEIEEERARSAYAVSAVGWPASTQNKAPYAIIASASKQRCM
jgi:hypothetical protein